MVILDRGLKLGYLASIEPEFDIGNDGNLDPPPLPPSYIAASGSYAIWNRRTPETDWLTELRSHLLQEVTQVLHS